ncbi:MAG: manganese-binding transcriptional regulator MntR [Methylocystis sp.]|nr:manganese-binding transcriptional regulator MntR [Methylocystis sp.]
MAKRFRDGRGAPAKLAALPAQADQAERFGKARAARATAIVEDYVELIGDLAAVSGRARMTDIARRLGVSHATVNNCVGRLEREGFVASKPYRGVTLTAAGEALAERVRARHRIVVNLLVAVGVPKDNAEIDAEGVEHHISDAALEAFVRYLARGGREG